MFGTGQPIANLLVWLTVFAVPLQALPGGGCGRRAKAISPPCCGDGQGVCRCCDHCRCAVDDKKSPDEPLAPPTGPDRSETLVLLAFTSQTVAFETPVEPGSNEVVTLQPLGFSSPAAQRCAVLCRFTL